MSDHNIHTVPKEAIDGGAGLTYLASVVNFVAEIVNPLLSTVGLLLAIVWWIYRIKGLREEDKERNKDKS